MLLDMEKGALNEYCKTHPNSLWFLTSSELRAIKKTKIKYVDKWQQILKIDLFLCYWFNLSKMQYHRPGAWIAEISWFCSKCYIIYWSSSSSFHISKTLHSSIQSSQHIISYSPFQPPNSHHIQHFCIPIYKIHYFPTTLLIFADLAICKQFCNQLWVWIIMRKY